MSLLHLFRTPGLSTSRVQQLLARANGVLESPISRILTEACFNIETSEPLSEEEKSILRWLLSETFEPDGFGTRSFLSGSGTVLEVGPRMNFTTAWSTNAVGICHGCGLGKIRRIDAVVARIIADSRFIRRTDA